MAQDKDFLQDIKASLISSGELGRLRAAVRSSIINIASGQTVRGPFNNEIDFCNRLVKEYLEWNKYIYTSSMLSAESGMSDERVSREMLAREVGVNDNENSLQIPLLLSMTLMYKAENKT